MVPGFASAATNLLFATVPVFVLLAAILVYGAARRRDTEVAIGTLSRETVRRDRAHAVERPPARPSGREVERATALAQRGPSSSVVPAGHAPPAVWMPPDEERLGVTRRQFLNRSIVLPGGPDVDHRVSARGVGQGAPGL